ncbi:hypothetical protein AAFF_G00166570 [Aldrovandia affinis]|uniref:Uncharacterized protein n=1 Tax=Aldrovandia affinis TaxID=143900 RepID=A0AAD7RLW9_9TELE|nr:hypothetical protein AAFF_G00166570 [Aldrovandia affinis]
MAMGPPCLPVRRMAYIIKVHPTGQTSSTVAPDVVFQGLRLTMGDLRKTRGLCRRGKTRSSVGTVEDYGTVGKVLIVEEL